MSPILAYLKGIFNLIKIFITINNAEMTKVTNNPNDIMFLKMLTNFTIYIDSTD